MADFSIAARTTATAAASAALEIRAVSSIRIREIGIFMAAATASTFGLGRPANTPAGGTLVTGLAMDQGTSTSGIVISGQTTAPTAPAQFLRRIALPATIGSGVIWTFPTEGLIIPTGASLVIWNIALNGVADIYVEFDD